ncbi:hypothetical protein RJ639_046038 [Escallonia herrerae]|uniref:Protein SAR DEFICIENT 1 n=1 Tax=Escallonia herrerae TaxID=1293975 RepID=A0AA88W7I5_9ASTE|nr:hypothetical protein RJ639_046038 [Escallonia herrerae]
MPAKRSFHESGSDKDQQNEKRRRTRPTLASYVLETQPSCLFLVISEVLLGNFLQNFCSALEPMLRSVVNSEVERGLRRRTPPLTRSASLQIQALEPTSLMLMFSKDLSLPLFTGSKIVDVESNPLQVILVDTRGDQNVPTTLPYPLKVEIVVLDGDFPRGDCETWTSDEFGKNIVKERTGRRPLLAGELNLTMRDGFSPIGDIEFTDNSSWIRSRKFRLGSRVVQEARQGLKIKEAMTKAFVVKDHRGELPEVELKDKIEIEAEVLGQPCGAGVKTRRRWWGKRLEKGKKEYPPAIPWLARTENLPSAHMPWVFRRHYIADGRLVITEKKVEQHDILGDCQEMEEDGGGGGEMDSGDGVDDVGTTVMGGGKCFEYREGVRSVYKKHHPPMLKDEVWRLEKIGKDGAFHRKLASEGIKSVQDFLKLSIVNPSNLRTILGVGMSEKMWEVTLKHARTCVMGRKLYISHGPNYTIILNPICQVVKAVINGQIYTNRDLTISNRAFIENLVKDAYTNWNSLEEVDGMSNEPSLLTQGDFVDQYSNQCHATVRSDEHRARLMDESIQVASMPSNAIIQCNDWVVSSAYISSTPIENGAPYNFSESSSDGEVTFSRSFVHGS